MTMHAEYVRTGAAAARRASTHNPMELLGRMREADPTASFEHQFIKWRKAVERNEEANKAALLHAFRNYWTALDRDTARNRAVNPQQMAQAVADRAAADEANKTRFISFMFMEMIMPVCGKKLKDATFAECRKEGGLLSKIGKMGKPNEIVGQKLTEEKLRAIK